MTLLAIGLPVDCQRRVFALGGGPFEAHLRAKGIAVEVHGRRSRLDPVAVAALWRSIIEMRPDVVHSWSWMSTLVAGPICRLLRVPLIDGTIRDGSRHPEHPGLKRMGMACATTIVANSRAGARAWGVSTAKGRVVYNGFDWSRLVADGTAAVPDSALGADAEHPFIVVMTGRMEPAKDFRLVIAAARLLQKDARSFRFILVGHGPQREQLVAEAGNLVDDGTVTFPEAGLEVISYVRQAKAGILMTDPEWHLEGCSNAIMEYMACGLPVVCSEGGGNRELVEDGETGFVIAPSDPRLLAERIIYLRDHEAERRAMGEAGRRRIVETFSLKRMVDDFLRIYEEALSD